MGCCISKQHQGVLSEDLLEQLRCSYCRYYLLSPPLFLLSDGTTACGECSTGFKGATTRQLALEAVLGRIKFPCPYKAYGCEQKFKFGCSNSHRTSCVFKPSPCPSAPLVSCSWHGPMTMVEEHFRVVHPSLMSNGAFHFDVGKDKEQVFLVKKYESAFLIKYKYEAASTSLKYVVRYFAPDISVSDYKILLMNPRHFGDSVNLKGNRCSSFLHGVTLDDAPPLIISQFRDVLKEPTTLLVQFDLPLVGLSLSNKKQIVNYELLENYRCGECQHYLSLPIFDAPKGTICKNCADTKPYTETVSNTNENLQCTLSVLSIPCRWNKCSFIGNGYNIGAHEGNCLYQPQRCPSVGCAVPIVLANRNLMACHFLLHGFEYFSKESAYTSSFRKNYSRLLVGETKHGELVFIKHEIIANGRGAVNAFTLQSCKERKGDAAVVVFFEHSHCKLKSKRYVVESGNELRITPGDLPKCFVFSKEMCCRIEIL